VSCAMANGLAKLQAAKPSAQTARREMLKSVMVLYLR
jgi:hypothetical protein